MVELSFGISGGGHIEQHEVSVAYDSRYVSTGSLQCSKVFTPECIIPGSVNLAWSMESTIRFSSLAQSGCSTSPPSHLSLSLKVCVVELALGSSCFQLVWHFLMINILRRKHTAHNACELAPRNLRFGNSDFHKLGDGYRLVLLHSVHLLPQVSHGAWRQKPLFLRSSVWVDLDGFAVPASMR